MRKITLILVIILAGLVVYNFFFGHSAVKEARRLTNELKQQVDTLNQVAGKYEKMQQKYIKLYAELGEARLKVASLKEKLNTISQSQTNDAQSIRKRLNAVLIDLESLEVKLQLPVKHNDDIDSLRF